MKKLLCLWLCCCLLLCGCAVTSPADTSLKIVCSIFPQYDFLREITKGSDATLTLLLRPGQESHDYDPSSQDILAVHQSDLFVYVGGASDSWIDKTLRSVDTDQKEIVRLTALVDTLCEQHDHDHTAHAHAETYDEHVWTSPANAVTIVEKLTQIVCTLDAENASLYRQNADAYIARLQTLDTAFAETIRTAKRQTIVVADRFPLLYFCERYGLSHRAAFAGCAASVEPASADVQSLIDTVKAEKIPVVLQMELSAGRQVAQTVAESTGCAVRTFYACHNLSKSDFDAGATYLSLMQKNLITLKEALN